MHPAPSVSLSVRQSSVTKVLILPIISFYDFLYTVFSMSRGFIFTLDLLSVIYILSEGKITHQESRVHFSYESFCFQWNLIGLLLFFLQSRTLCRQLICPSVL